ncbi:MAG: DUF177 domain-containing protein [Bauldia sp.]|nr:DUF177 domain-containing protein [Bauldia sp.]
MNDAPHLSRNVNVAAIPSAGRAETIVATDAELTAIASAFGLVAVGALSAELKIERPAADVVVVDGRVRASIVQNCVVSLVPVAQEIDEPIHLRFVDAASAKAPAPPRPGAEVMIAAESMDLPETWSGPAIDVGAVVLEHFALAIDPYPRAPGATLADEADESASAVEESPFAVLAGLTAKKK